MENNIEFKIIGDYIELMALLKALSIAQTGGHAKMIVDDGEVIRIPIPSLSEDRRKELTKVASKFSEDSKISIRSHRRTGIDELGKMKDDISADDLKRSETQIQELTDKYVKKVDELLSVKQNELLEV